MDQKEITVGSSKNQDDVEEDIGRKLETNVLQDGVQVHRAKNSPGCSVTKRMEVNDVSSSDAKTEVVMDGDKGDIITEGDRGSNVSGRPADGKNTFDRGGHDKSGIGSSDSRNTSNRIIYDKSGTGLTDDRMASNRADHYKIGFRPTDGKKACDRVGRDKIGFRPANDKKACYQDDHDRGSTGSAYDKFPFDCAFHAPGSIGLADRKVVSAHVSQANSAISYDDHKDAYDLVGHASSRDGSVDDSNACDRGGSSSIGAPDDKGKFGHHGDVSGGMKFVYEDDCDSSGEASSNVRYADGKDVCYHTEDDSNSTTSEAGDDNDGACGNNSGGISYTDSRDAFGGIDNESEFVDDTHLSRHVMAAYPADVTNEEAFYLSDDSFCDDYSEVASDRFVGEYASGDGVIHSFEERVDATGGDGCDDYWEGYGKIINCWNEEEERDEYNDDDDDYDDGDEEEENGEEEEEEEEEEEGEDYWGEGYEDDSYLDYPGVLGVSTKRSQIESINNLCNFSANSPQSPWPVPLTGPLWPLTDKGNGQGDFKTSKGAFNEGRKRNSGSLPKCQLSRRKIDNDLETQSRAKATLDEHNLMVSGLNDNYKRRIAQLY